MAILTHSIAAFDDHRVRVELDVDDATWRAVLVRVVNDSLNDLAVEVIRRSDGLTRARVFPAGSGTTTFSLPTAVAQRFIYTRQEQQPNGRWRLGGITVNCLWPA